MKPLQIKICLYDITLSCWSPPQSYWLFSVEDYKFFLNSIKMLLKKARIQGEPNKETEAYLADTRAPQMDNNL